VFTEAEGITSPGKRAGRKPADIGVLFKCKGREILLYQMGLAALTSGERNSILEGVSKT